MYSKVRLTIYDKIIKQVLDTDNITSSVVN